jgi:hypothetical protein
MMIKVKCESGSLFFFFFFDGRFQQTYCDMSLGPKKRSSAAGSTTGPRMAGTPVHFHVYRSKPFNLRAKVSLFFLHK